MTDIGKKFEAAIGGGLENTPGVSADRARDHRDGYASITYGWDWLAFRKPYLLYLECKAISGNTLNFKGDIRKSQWEQLPPKNEVDGVIAGFIVWFQDHDRTVFVPVNEMLRLRANGQKSLNIKDLDGSTDLHFIEVPGEKKRRYFAYDMQAFLDAHDDRHQWLKREE